MLILQRSHDTPHHRLGHRRAHGADLFRPGALLRPPRREEHVGVLRLRALGSVVAGGAVDGRDHVQQRHAELGDAAGAAVRRRRQLAMVGVRADGCVDGLFLRPAVAPFRRDDRPRVLRAAVFGDGSLRRPRLPCDLPRAVLQLLHHGDGHARGVQDCQHPLRTAAVADDPDLRRIQRRLCRARGALGRARDRHGAVLHQDDCRDRRGVFFTEGSRPAHRRRQQRTLRPSRAGARARCAAGQLSGGGAAGAIADRRQRPADPRRDAELRAERARVDDLHRTDCHRLVGELVSRRGARRRQLHRAADAGLEIRKGLPRRHAVLQSRPLRPAPMALDPHRTLLDHHLPRAEGHPGGVPRGRSED